MLEAFFLKGSKIIVVDKNTIKNSKEGYFETVGLILSEADIKALYKRMQESKENI